MIEKMNFVTLTGPKGDFDRIVDTYLTKYDIHLENALTELGSDTNLKPFVESNPYKTYADKALELLKLAQLVDLPQTKYISFKESNQIVTNINSQIKSLITERDTLNEASKRHKELIEKIEPFRHLNYDLKTILDFKFIRYRFGRVPHHYYNQFTKYINDNKNTIFDECDSDENYVWGVYFVPSSLSTQVDAIYTSIHFERVYMPDEYTGTPEAAYLEMKNNLDLVDNKIQSLNAKINMVLLSNQQDLVNAYHSYIRLSHNFDVRKKAACTRAKQKVFYILCGWLSSNDTKSFEEEIKQDTEVFYVLEDSNSKTASTPPTKLNNRGIFKPFEMFIGMYSLPAYNEMDPTKFIAISYALMFGIMFGDVGQGLLLVLGGLYFYKKKKMELGAILSLSGCFSTVFGFLYGSVFGYEHILPTLWMKPMENIMTTLIIAVVFGVGLIILAILMNLVNAYKAKDYGRLFFGTNGITGLVFYGSIVIAILLMFTGNNIKGGIGLLGIIIGLPLIILFFKEPLTHLIEKNKKIFPENKVMFFVESFFELFEVVLSYITNSISFVRIGAFALSHAGMMEVVLMLGNATSSQPNYVIIILGNLLVMGLEGLIVGIQVLRLEYYEMFSRFYTGSGRPFKSYKETQNNQSL